MGLILLSVKGKEFLTAELEHSCTRNAEAEDKVDICAPVMPKGILSVTKMEQQSPPEVKIIARKNFSIFRLCKPALSEFTGCFLAWIFSLSAVDWTHFSHVRAYILQVSVLNFGKKFTRSLLKLIPVGWNAPLRKLLAFNLSN